MSDPLSSTPLADGFRMPGEFEPHDGTWMAWPERPDNWRLGAKPAQQAFVEVAEAIAESEPVTMAVSAGQWRHARDLLSDAVRVVELSTNDSWMRDIGPTFVIDDRGGRRGIDWGFNAWGGLQGGLYFPWDLDDQAAAKVLATERAPRYRAPLILEGGSIHVDGEGTLVTTEECLLNHNRNPQLDRRAITELLHQYTGAEKVIWIPRGAFDDETNGHIDNLVCFCRPGVVALGWTDDRDDPQYEISLDARRRLGAARDARGRQLEVVPVPIPPPVRITAQEAAGVDAIPGTLPRQAGDRLAASYVNAYIANHHVIVPRLDPTTDDIAAQVFSELFPDRAVIGVDSREILLGGGNIHCITQQVPAIPDRPSWGQPVRSVP